MIWVPFGAGGCSTAVTGLGEPWGCSTPRGKVGVAALGPPPRDHVPEHPLFYPSTILPPVVVLLGEKPHAPRVSAPRRYQHPP